MRHSREDRICTGWGNFVDTKPWARQNTNKRNKVKILEDNDLINCGD